MEFYARSSLWQYCFIPHTLVWSFTHVVHCDNIVSYNIHWYRSFTHLNQAPLYIVSALFAFSLTGNHPSEPSLTRERANFLPFEGGVRWVLFINNLPPKHINKLYFKIIRNGTIYADENTFCSKTSSNRFNGIACANRAIYDSSFWK